MAYEVRFARRPIHDLDSIYGAINAESSDAAEGWFRGLEAQVLSLETLPYRCAITPERETVRHLLYGNKPHVYRVLFTIDEEAKVVHVAQIRHGARHPLKR